MAITKESKIPEGTVKQFKAPTTNVPVTADQRVCMGAGMVQLLTPGLKELHAVYIGGVRYEVVEYRDIIVDDKKENNWKTVSYPYVMFDHRPEEGCVYRSEVSNDGIWQNGVEFVVEGVW